MIHEDLFYTCEKYHEATLTLASGSGPLEERLWSVWISHFLGLRPEQFPDEVREEHSKIYRTLERSAKPSGYDLRGTCSLGEMEERHLAEEIVSVFLKLSRMKAIIRHEEDTLHTMKAELGLS